MSVRRSSALNVVQLCRPHSAFGERHDWSSEQLEQMKQTKTLNVFDMLSPKYDFPQKLETVRNWIANENLELIRGDLGHNGTNAKARRSFLTSDLCSSIRQRLGGARRATGGQAVGRAIVRMVPPRT
jgi:hypothetical protein